LNPSVSGPVSFLYIAGFLLVVFSEPGGVFLTRQPSGRNGWIYNREDAAQAAEVLRWVGAMLPASGIAERISGAVTAGRRRE
jgi:hypothetical protein